jgi:hypothetical protein
VAIARRDFTSVANTVAVTTHAINPPTLAQPGDVGIVSLSTNGSALSAGPGAAWTAVGTVPIPDSTNPRTLTFHRTLDGTTADNFSGDTAAAVTSGLNYVVYSGVDTTTSLDVAPFETGSNTAAYPAC